MFWVAVVVHFPIDSTIFKSVSLISLRIFANGQLEFGDLS